MKVSSLQFFIGLIGISLCSMSAVGQHRDQKIVTTRTAHTPVTCTAHVNYAGMPRWGATVRTVPTGAVAYKYHRSLYYAHNGVYYGRHTGGYAVVRPARGLRVNILPVGYRTVAVGPSIYYGKQGASWARIMSVFYYYGTYYQQGPAGYTVVSPPVGAVVDSLPEGYTVENINGTEYYVLDGVTYAEVDAPEYPNGVGYEVVRI